MAYIVSPQQANYHAQLVM